MDYLEKMLTEKWETVKEKALNGEDVDGVEVLTDFERGKIESGRFTVDHYKDRIIKRLEKGYTWPQVEKYKRCMALPADNIDSVTISLDWRRNVYGMQARATIDIIHESGRCERLEGERTSGCGYDKYSTAVVYALNKSDYMYKLLYEHLNQQMDLPKDKRWFGYGTGASYVRRSGGLPWFENGLGINTTLDTIELITGLTHVTEHETRNSDFYIIAK